MPMDIYQRLKKDHDRQRELMDELENTEGASDERKALWQALYAELEAHALAEEQTLYSELMERPDGTEKARHSVAEHKEMSDIAEELNDMKMSSSGWLNRFKTLVEKVTHHVDEEEEEVFPKARQVIADDVALRLADDFEERKSAELDEI